MKRLRIIFSTTLGWNPGDEFILFGIRNLLSSFGLKFDEIIYNRHPMIRTKFDAINRLLALGAYLFADNPDMQLKRLLSGRYEFMDNSFKKTSQKIADYIIIAGTPEWAGPRNEELLSWAVNNKVHGALVGVGLKNNITKNARRFLSEFAELITTRDNAAYEQLKAFGAIKGVCPALFAAPETKKVERIENIEAKKRGVNPWDYPTFQCCTELKTYALKNYLKKNKNDAVFVGIRWSECGIRGKEKFYSWREDPPHYRVHPLLNWSEKMVWDYIKKNNIPYNPLYDKEDHNGLVYRSIGCYPCTKPTRKEGEERAGRNQEKEEIMEHLRALGYM